MRNGNQKKKLTLTVLAGLVALGTSCGRKPAATPTKPDLVHGIRIETVSVSAVEDFYEATGTVRSRTTTSISANVMGKVTLLPVREGQRVSVGQLVATIDSRESASRVRLAEAGLKQAQEAAGEADQAVSAARAAQVAGEARKRLADSTLTRYRDLLDRKSVSPQEYDEVRARQEMAAAEASRDGEMLKVAIARRQQALARIEQAKEEVSGSRVTASYSRITSPMNGIVTARLVEAGAMAMPGSPLLTIEDGSHYRLEAAVEESQLGKIRVGEHAFVRIDALGGDSFECRVAEVVPTADPGSRSYAVKIDLPARQGIRSGLFAVARFISGQQRKAILVPARAVVQRGQLAGVFVIDTGGVAHLRLIKTGRSFGEKIEVLSGLNDGERIAVDGAEKLNDGNRVQ